MPLSLLELTNLIDDTKETLARSSEKLGGISGVIVFNCAHRALELEYKKPHREIRRGVCRGSDNRIQFLRGAVHRAYEPDCHHDCIQIAQPEHAQHIVLVNVHRQTSEKRRYPMAGQGQGNPAVVGLAGFGLTTLLLQFHNLGWCGTGVVFCTAIILGGGAQLVAGFQEFRCGNNFGYSAFTVFGAFWLALGLIWLILDLAGRAEHLYRQPSENCPAGYWHVPAGLYAVCRHYVGGLAANQLHDGMYLHYGSRRIYRP